MSVRCGGGSLVSRIYLRMSCNGDWEGIIGNMWCFREDLCIGGFGGRSLVGVKVVSSVVCDGIVLWFVVWMW